MSTALVALSPQVSTENLLHHLDNAQAYNDCVQPCTDICSHKLPRQASTTSCVTIYTPAMDLGMHRLHRNDQSLHWSGETRHEQYVLCAGMAVFDTMRHIRPNVSTVCVGLAASMGAFLLASGQQVRIFHQQTQCFISCCTVLGSDCL